MKNYIFLFAFVFITFLMPIHFFLMGDNWGYGIQGYFYRYQVADQGNSFITIIQEIGYVSSGLIQGNSAFSILFWSVGSFFIVSAFFLFTLFLNEDSKNSVNMKTSVLIFFSIICIILSSIFQYGILFYGPAGVSILFGIPIIALYAWLINEYFE